MSNPYTSQSISNYNTTPPSNDGATTLANKVSWATIKTKLADPLNTFAAAINSAVSTAFGTIFLNSTSSITSTYTIQNSDRGKLIVLNGAIGFTVTLPASSAVGDGWIVTLKNTGSTTVTVAPNGTDTIEGANSSITMTSQNGAIVFVTNGAGAWNIVSRALGYTPVNKAGDTMSGALNWSSATVASAAETNIGGATGNYCLISGTTTITSFSAAQAGAVRVCEFQGVLTLTHNASILILPGAKNIITAAGDVGVFVSEGPGIWRCVSYLPASGASLSGYNTALVVSGTSYTTPASTSARTTFRFRLVSGGGGGGGASSTNGAGGGASGSIEDVIISGIAPSTVLTCAIGGGGAGGTTGAGGGAGGNTTITINLTTYTSYGGGGGTPGGASPGKGGSQGAGGNGSYHHPGTPGGHGRSDAGGNGSSPAFLGSGGLGGLTGVTIATAGNGYGGGGGGGETPSSAGAAGTAGCILVEWWN